MKKNSVQKQKNERKKKKKQYPTENMKKAIAAVQKEGYSFRQAGDKFGVPWGTLYRKLRLPEKADATSGPPTVLEDHQEDEIVTWMQYRAERGYPVSKLELLNAVSTYVRDLEVENPFTASRPGRHWYECFIRRHPDVPIGPIRTKTLEQNSSTEKHLQEWFYKTKTYLKNQNLLNIEGTRIFSLSEMDIALRPNAKKSNPDGTTTNSITTLFTYNADGTQAPPLVMYKYKNYVPKEVIRNCPSHWGIGLSETGSIVTRTFFEYIVNVFHPWLLKQNLTFPIIMYIDKHALHVSVPLAIFCKENNIELLAIPRNFSHLIQPLNIALFRPFEKTWEKTVSQWKMQNNTKSLKKEKFPLVLKITLDSLEEKKIIVEGFKAAGLVPFDPSIVNYDSLKKRKYTTARNLETTKLQSLVSSELFQEKLHLQSFEANLPKQLLNNFKKCEKSAVWTGDVEKRGMFEYWLKIKNAATAVIV